MDTNGANFKQIKNPKTKKWHRVGHVRPLMVQEGPEGFSIEAAFCFFYIGLNLYMVLTVVALSMVLTGNTRKYTKRKSMSLDPEAPWCECGEYKCQKSEGRFRKKCYRCRTNKDGASAAATGSSHTGTETEAGPSQQQERPSNTLRHSSGSVLSPTPTVRGARPRGSTWDGSAYVFTDPNTTRERQQTARGGRGFSTLQPSWLTDFSWLRCEKDPALMAQTAGRCSTESDDGVACPGCTWYQVQSPVLRRLQKPDRQRLQRSHRLPDV